MPGTENKKPVYTQPIWVFVVLWVIIFVLYFPARHAGWVSDTCEWLQRIRTSSFTDFVNAKQSRGSLYQFTQITTYVFYQIFREHALAWYVWFITLQAVNSALLYAICKKLFERSGVKNGVFIALGGVFLFSICPHISEVLVWKASYHYLQAMMLMLIVLYCTQQYINAPKIKYILIVVPIFAASIFSHEFFFLTPVFVLTLILYYRLVLKTDITHIKKAFLSFVVPLVLLSIVHIVLVRVNTGSASGGVGDEINQTLTGYLRKPPSYLYHILFFGRFGTHEFRQSVYNFFVSTGGLILVYSVLLVLCGYIIARFKHFNPNSKAATLIFIWLLLCVAIACPMWFPYIQTVQFDRYAYFMLPLIYMLLFFALAAIRFKDIAITFTIVYAFINVYFTLRVNNYWKNSDTVVKNLLRTVPETGDKTVLLLNIPANMNGVPMVGPFLHFSFRKMYNLHNTRQINNTTYDVVSYNMLTPADGAHVLVINDSMLHVTLNQWATWWWYGMVGAFSYENNDYKLNMIDVGHWYELTLKKPASQYLLLYQVGDTWKTVDWSSRSDQY